MRQCYYKLYGDIIAWWDNRHRSIQSDNGHRIDQRDGLYI